MIKKQKISILFLFSFYHSSYARTVKNNSNSIPITSNTTPKEKINISNEKVLSKVIRSTNKIPLIKNTSNTKIVLNKNSEIVNDKNESQKISEKEIPKLKIIPKIATKPTTKIDSQVEKKSIDISSDASVTSILKPTNTQSFNSININNSTNINFDSSSLDSIDQFFSVFPDPSKPEYALLPNLEKTINHIYDESLHLPPILINAIKRFYSFLQCEVFDTQFSKEQLAIIELQSKINIALEKNDPLIDSLNKQLNQANTNYWQAIKNLDSSIVELCSNSKFWQNHLQIFIASSFDYEYNLLEITHKDEKQIFSMLPKFEIAYYTKDFTSLRIDSEIVRTFLILLELIRERLITQCNNWKKINSQEELYEAIITFKESEDYLKQKKFTDAIFSNKTYPIITQNPIINNQNIISSGFKDFLEIEIIDNKPFLSVIKRFEKMMIIDSKTKTLSLTSLGNLLFQFVPATNTTSERLIFSDFFSDLFQETETGYEPKKLYMTLLALSGIKLLNNSLEYLFNTANLESTMAQLATIDSNLLLKFPMINPYQPSDYLYLDDINYLKAGSSTLDKQIPTNQTPQASAQNIFSKIKKGINSAVKSVAKNVVQMANSVKNAGETFSSEVVPEIKTLGKTFAEATKDIGYVTRDIAIATGYSIEGIGSSAAREKAAKTMNNAMQNLDHFFEQGANIIQEIGDIGKTTLHLASNVAMNGLVVFNPLAWGATAFLTLSGSNFRDEVSNFLNSTIDLIIDAGVTSTQVTTNYFMKSVQLTTQAIMFATQAIIALTAGITTGDYSDISSLGTEFLKDTVSALLRPIKLVFNGFAKAMTDVMLATAYLASTIVDASINIGGAASATAAAIYGGDPTAAFNNVKEKVNEHRRLITSVVSIVIVSAASIVLSPGMGIVGATLMTAIFGGMMGIERQISVVFSKEDFLSIC